MIRLSEPNDLEQIIDIYNQAVDARFQTGYTRRRNVADEIEWYKGHTPDKYPILVYERDGIVAGWLSLSPYRAGRDAFKYTTEVSYFLDSKYTGHGIGRLLLQKGLETAQQSGYRVVVAIILSPNKASIKLVEKHGFTLWGKLPEVADFDGDMCDHLYYGIKL